MFLREDNDFDFPELNSIPTGHSLRVHTTNNWAMIAAAAISAAGAIASSMSKDDAPKDYEPEVLPKTVSGNVTNDLDMLYDVTATEAVSKLTLDMSTWSIEDREFFTNTWQPFQESVIDANQELLPDIIENSGTALKQNLEDMMGGGLLKKVFRQQITDSGSDINRFAKDFATQVDNIPSPEQRVGQAISGVEQRFGEAGKEMKRQMGAKGLDVSEASLREMAIGKASAKAGATQQAQQMAREEKLGALEKGLGVLGAVQQSQSNMLNADRALTQSGANILPQVGGVMDQQSVSEAGEIGAGLQQAGAELLLGTRSATKDAKFTQAGVQVPRFFDKGTGKVVDAAGNEIITPKPKNPWLGGSNNTPEFGSVSSGLGLPGVGGADSDGSTGPGTGGMGTGGNEAGQAPGTDLGN